MIPSQKQIANKQRILWLDAVKGIAILLVLVSHSEFGEYAQAHSENLTLCYLEKFLELAFASYMPIFYVMSGYTCKLKPNLLHQRFMRLLAPYMQWGSIYLILYWITLFVQNKSYVDYFQAAGGMMYSRFSLFPIETENYIRLLPPGSAPLWFLTSLFTSYALFLLILQYEKYKNFIIPTYIAATLLLSFSPVLFPWSLDVAPAGAIFLYTGYLLKRSQLFANAISKPIIISLALLPLYVLLAMYNGNINMSVREYGDHPFLSPILFLIIGTIGSFLYCTFSLFIEKIHLGALLAYFGRISLTLLCSHMLVYGGLKSIFAAKSPLFCNLFTSENYLFILQIPTAIIFAAMVTECLNRLNGRLKKHFSA